jgi:hypothetical protein
MDAACWIISGRYSMQKFKHCIFATRFTKYLIGYFKMVMSDK